MGLRAAVRRRLGTCEGVADGWEPLLRAASWMYRAAVGVRNRWYDEQLGIRRLPAPVISVGNLSVGGTGKTPLVMFLAKSLQEQGLKVAVLSRGYGRRHGPAVLQVSAGEGSLVPVSMAGDEPESMAQCLRGVSVWVGKDRFRVGLAAWAKERPHVFILDDGFQHRGLHRDLDLVVARLPRPWGNSRLLPAGPLREPLGSLARAHLLVLTGDGDADARNLQVLATVGIPTLRARLRPKALRPLAGGQSQRVEGVWGRRVALVCAIGNPEGFKATVEKLGAEIGPCLFFPDHHWYTPQDAARIQSLAQAEELILTTEKDASKLQAVGLHMPRLMAVEVGLELAAEELLNQALAPLVRTAGISV